MAITASSSQLNLGTRNRSDTAQGTRPVTRRRANALLPNSPRPIIPMQQQDVATDSATQDNGEEGSAGAQESNKISMMEYTRLCDGVMSEAYTKIKIPAQKMLAQDTAKYRQKRGIPILLKEIAEVRQDLRERMANLQDMEVEGDATEKHQKFQNVVAVMIQADLDIDSLRRKNAEFAPDANHYLSLLKGKYSLQHPLYTLVKSYRAMPETGATEQEKQKSKLRRGAKKVKTVAETMLDLMSGSKDVSKEHASHHDNEVLKGRIESVWYLDGIANAFTLLTSGYNLLKGFASSKKKTNEDIGEMIDNFATFVTSIFSTMESFGLKQLEKAVPIVGAIFTIISSLFNGVTVMRNLGKAIGNRKVMAQAKRGLEDRLVRNRDKEKDLGHQVPELQTMIKRRGGKHEGVSATTVAQQRQAFRQGFEQENIYKKKVELKQQRLVLLNKENKTPQDELAIQRLDQQIGQLRMAQDIQRLGVTDEAKSKQSKKIRSNSIKLVEIALDLASAIAKLFPGIGDLVSAGISLGKGIFDAGSKLGKWIYKQTKWYAAKEEQKAQRRSLLADTIVERLDMLANVNYDLATLYNPNAKPDAYVVKAVYKEYDTLAVDLQRGMGAAPEVLATAQSKDVLKSRLALAFSQEG